LALQLHFSKTYNYGSDDSISLPIVLRVGDSSADLVASVDTGASYCLFDRKYGEALGLNVEFGALKVFVTANSRFEAFGHEVTIDALGIETHTTVFFFADPIIRKNVLGRHGWLDRMKIGIVDYDQMLYLAEYDEVV